MKKIYKKLIFVMCTFALIISFCSCSIDSEIIGHGTKGEIDNINWDEYDKLIFEAKIMDATDERDLVLHRAEELLLNTGCVIPIGRNNIKYLMRDSIKGAYFDLSGALHYENIYDENKKDEIGIQILDDIEYLDPSKVSYLTEFSLLYSMFPRLLDADKDNNMVYDLLVDYKESDDGLTYTFKIRDDNYWSDGKKLTAQDFVFGWKTSAHNYYLNEAARCLNVIEGFPDNLNVYAVDDTTFVVKLKNPCGYFYSIVASLATAPLREDMVNMGENWWTNMPLVTCGAYYVDNMVWGSNIVLKKNPYYYDAKHVKTERINFMIGTDVSTILNAYKSGNLDIATTISIDVKHDDIKTCETIEALYMKFNSKAKLFEGMSSYEATKFRQAISYLIDRDFLAKVSNDSIITCYTLINELYSDHTFYDTFVKNTDKYKYPYSNGYYEEYNPDKAREILKEIGFHFDDDGKVIEDVAFELQCEPQYTEYVTILQSDFAKLGIKIKISTINYDYVYDGNYTAIIERWSLGYYDPLNLLEYYISTSLSNTTFLGRDFPK